MTRIIDLDAIERLNLVICAVAAAVSLVLASAGFTGGLVVGTAIEAVNYRVLRRATERLFRGELSGGGAWSAAFAVRFLFLGAAMAAALVAGAHPVGLVLGLSTVVPAAVVVALRKPAPAVPGPAAPPPDDASWDRWNPWLAREHDDADREES